MYTLLVFQSEVLIGKIDCVGEIFIMAIRKIAKMGHPKLLRKAEQINDPTRDDIAQISVDMVETMRDAFGTGIAAPQIYESVRMIVYTIASGNHADENSLREEQPLTILVNPTLEILTDEMSLDWEGCLSVPGLRGLVPRYEQLILRALSLDGSKVEYKATGFHARVLQHECDHLDGILYPQRMEDLRHLVFESEFHHITSSASDGLQAK